MVTDPASGGAGRGVDPDVGVAATVAATVTVAVGATVGVGDGVSDGVGVEVRVGRGEGVAEGAIVADDVGVADASSITATAATSSAGNEVSPSISSMVEAGSSSTPRRLAVVGSAATIVTIGGGPALAPPTESADFVPAGSLSADPAWLAGRRMPSFVSRILSVPDILQRRFCFSRRLLNRGSSGDGYSGRDGNGLSFTRAGSNIQSKGRRRDSNAAC